MLRSRILRTPPASRTTSSGSDEEIVYDYTGIPTLQCVCGCDTFKVLIMLDPEDHTISWYTLTGYCYLCGARVSLPEPTDSMSLVPDRV